MWTRRALLATATVGTVGLVAADRAAATPGGFPPPVTLRPAGDAAATARLTELISGYLQPTPDHPGHPSYPGAVAVVAVDGAMVGPVAVGYALRYADRATELPPAEWLPTTVGTAYDLASLTKLFTTVLALRLAESRVLDLDAPVRRVLPGFTGAGKEAVTPRLLLRHLSGLPADVDLVHRPPGVDAASRLLSTPLAHPPGTRYVYSDIGMATLGLVLEAVGGAGLDALLREHVTGVLGLAGTGYRPLDPHGQPGRPPGDVAATEAEPWVGRPMLRGAVHDEMAYALGGVSGHAGLFGTATDLAVFGQALLNGGWYAGARLLRPATLAAALRPGATSPYGLGFEVNQPSFMGGLAGPRSFGHTGFTGTSLVVDPTRRALAVLLSNRVHPTRDWGVMNAARRRLGDLVVALAGHSQQFGTQP